MMRMLRLAAISIIAIQSALLSQEKPAELLPVPKGPEQNKADAPIRAQYKAGFTSRDAFERAALCKTLHDLAKEEKDPVRRYVLLRDSRDLAVDSGDLTLCMSIIDEMAERYAVLSAEMKGDALSIAPDKSRADPETLFNAYLKVADDNLKTWNLDVAGKAAYMASKLAGRNAAASAMAKQRDTTVRFRMRELNQFRQAAGKLERNPDDAAANLTVGRHVCFNANLWDKGLPYLSKGSTGALKALAERDLANPAEPAEMASLADAWWDYSEPKMAAGLARRRAAYWYAKAIPGLAGDKKAEAEKRVAEITP